MTRRRFAQTVLDLLRQGVSPPKLAASLALGSLIGVIPVLGITTVLCMAVALLFRLNLVAIQLANWLVYPLQIALLYPFYWVGARLFGTGEFELSGSEIFHLLSTDWVMAIREFWDATLRAVAAWLIASLALGPPLYAALGFLLRSAWRSNSSSRVQP
ncbi:MAG: DUF2062 domain-containing protein [Kiritimatiellae bacterium]|nr:DUF2062 domain-containing protein [Kiritimatiellia bacterium]MDW8458972.1 DUF2062 domain-containing protein [Verrucomicrobiota bacterium]